MARPADTRTKPATLTIPEAAARLGVSRGLGYELAARGQIPVLRLGRRLVVPAHAFEIWLADVRPKPTEE